jgi:hypothetical protein
VPKAEKFYSDDLLMETHFNWHSVYMFMAASSRRGDLFLAWHRSELDLFNRWRTFFGYPRVPYWNPTTPWIGPGTSLARVHPSVSPPPRAAFSIRHDLITLDLTDGGLATATEGEYDLVTQTQSRGTNAQFVAANHVLRTETVRNVIGWDVEFWNARNGVASLPTWWAPNTGQTATDPWFANQCPALATPTDAEGTNTCFASSKRSFDDYTLRQLGESIESGLYALDFQVNYHALGHIAPSFDMAETWTSMRDPVFWGWHRSIDSILTRWQLTRGIEAAPNIPLSLYGRPQWAFNWDTVRVAFSNRVVPEFVHPGHVTVNGGPATVVGDISFDGTGYILAFTGFPVPPSGTVRLVVRREMNDPARASLDAGRPAPTLIFSTFGKILVPPVSRYSYVRP